MSGRPRPSRFPEPSPFQRAIRRNAAVVGVMRFLFGVGVGLGWVWESVLRPVSRPFRRAAVWAASSYMRAFNRFTIRSSGRRSRPRAGLMIVATVCAGYLLPTIAVFLSDAMMFALLYDTEEVYLTGSQEIDPAINLHNVKGCESEDCTPDNALYYRVVDNNMNSVWSWLNNGHPFYPDFVAASAGNGFSKCTVTSYGIRWKLVTRNFEWYPFMLRAHCRSTGLAPKDPTR